MPDKQSHEAYEEITMPVDLRGEILRRYTAARKARTGRIAQLSAAACLVLVIATALLLLYQRPGIYVGGNRLTASQTAVQTETVSYAGSFQRGADDAQSMRQTQSAIALKTGYNRDVCITVDGGMLLTEADGTWQYAGQSAALAAGQTVFWCPEGHGGDKPVLCTVADADGTLLQTLVLRYDETEHIYYLHTK